MLHYGFFASNFAAMNLAKEKTIGHKILSLWLKIHELCLLFTSENQTKETS